MILDTNALSAIADGDSAILPFLQQATAMAIPVVVLGEFRYGIRQSRRKTSYERWIEEYLPTYRVLVIDVDTSEQYVEIREELKRKGRPIPSNDIWIAALARQHSLPVLSQDQHFDSVGNVKRLSW